MTDKVAGPFTWVAEGLAARYDTEFLAIAHINDREHSRKMCPLCTAAGQYQVLAQEYDQLQADNEDLRRIIHSLTLVLDKKGTES